MNPVAIQTAPEHVQEEFEKLRRQQRVSGMAVTIASEAIAAALRGEPTGLKDLPGNDASAADWHAWFMQAAANRLEG